MTRLILMIVLMTPAFAMAAGDPEAGRDKSVPCQACHGEDGLGIDPMYPIIAGQYPDYIEKALKDYRGGSRTNALMSGFATNLTDQDIEDLAAWYSSQPGLQDLDSD